MKITFNKQQICILRDLVSRSSEHLKQAEDAAVVDLKLAINEAVKVRYTMLNILDNALIDLNQASSIKTKIKKRR